MVDKQTAGTVVVVDDDTDIRETLATILETYGYDALTAANGEEALAVMRARPGARVVLLDMMMPVMDGWEFRRYQLQDPELAQVPVVVLSGAGQIREIAKEVGAADFLEKPVEMKRLLDVIRRWCR